MFGASNLSIAEILATEDFKDAQLLAGEKGINNIVKWVHILEVREYVGESVNGGELILSTGIGFSSNEVAINYFKQLIKKNISGLCLEIGTYITEVPREMISLAKENNCPLIIFKRTIRFIDITKNIINLLTDQENIYTNQKRQPWRKSKWILDCIGGNLKEDKIYSFLGKSKIEIKKASFFVLMINCFDQLQNNLSNIKNIEDQFCQINILLSNVFKKNEFEGYSTISHNSLVYIIIDWGNKKTWKQRMSYILKSLEIFRKDFIKSEIIIGCGRYINNLIDIPLSYQSALETVKIRQKIMTADPFFEDLHIYRVFSLIDLGQSSAQLKNFTIDYLKPLLDNDNQTDGTLIKTLKAYLECNGSKQKTAEKIYISRQTLYYRLQKIENLLGTDLLWPPKKLAIEFAIVAHEYLQSNSST